MYRRLKDFSICMCVAILLWCGFVAVNAKDASLLVANSATDESASFAFEVQADGTAVILGCTGNKTNCNIPETIEGHTVVGIGEGAFRNRRFLRSVSMPDTVKWVGDEAFADCDLLREIRWSSRLQSVGEAACADCFSLRTASLPNSLKEIPFSMFLGCTRLKTVTCSPDVVKIDGFAFWGCTKLEHFTFPDALSELGDTAFKECKSLREAILPDGLAELRYDTFMECTHLQSVRLPAQLKAIGAGAFAQCWDLQSIRIPDSVETIGSMAFNGCSSRLTVIGKTGGAAWQYCAENTEADFFFIGDDFTFQDAQTGACTRMTNPFLHDLFYGGNLLIGSIVTIPLRLYGDLLHLFIR